jgi:hypothetical protein
MRFPLLESVVVLSLVANGLACGAEEHEAVDLAGTTEACPIPDRTLCRPALASGQGSAPSGGGTTTAPGGEAASDAGTVLLDSGAPPPFGSTGADNAPGGSGTPGGGPISPVQDAALSPF